jgi:N-acetylneuraminate lyase
MARALHLLLTAAAVASRAAAAAPKVEPLNTDGLIAAVVTPMTADGMNINYTVVKSQAAYLAKTGVKRAYIAGTTGESVSLTTDERMALLEQWEKVAAGFGLDYLVHVGAESITDVVALAAHAQDHGSIAIGVMPPVFFKPATMTNLGQWMELACGAASNIPCYYYHIPSQTGVEFDMLPLLEEMDSRGVANFAGVKYTGLYETRAFPDLMRCQAYDGGRFDIMSGREEVMVEAMAVGVKGFIGSQFNYGGDIYNAIHSEADLDKRNAKQLASIELLLAWIDGTPAGVDGNKILVNLAGVPVGPARLPSLPPSDDDVASLKAAVVGWCGEYLSLFGATASAL